MTNSSDAYEPSEQAEPQHDGASLEPLDADEPAPRPAIEDHMRRQSDLMGSMLAELRKLARVQGIEEFSVWNLFGGLAQVLVFLSMFLWFLGDTPPLETPFLMLALILQLMALTFFTIGK